MPVGLVGAIGWVSADGLVEFPPLPTPPAGPLPPAVPVPAVPAPGTPVPAGVIPISSSRSSFDRSLWRMWIAATRNPKNRNWPVPVWRKIGHFQWDDPGFTAIAVHPQVNNLWLRLEARRRAPAFGGRQFRRFGAGRMGSRDGLHAAGSIAVLHRLSEDCGSVRFVRRR